jgi:hypothetical protein
MIKKTPEEVEKIIAKVIFKLVKEGFSKQELGRFFNMSAIKVGKYVKSVDVDNELFDEQLDAYRVVAIAMRNKSLVRPNFCSLCGKQCRPDAHHDDYNKPLDILWLCRSCHRKRDNQIKVS